MANGEEKQSFLLEWYKLQREHELELNKATLQYEHERLKFLAYLNGGAATAFLTFFAAMWKDAPRPGLWTFLAIACWAVGLYAAWEAWSSAHLGQSAYTKAYRMRRYAEELRRDPQSRTGIEEIHPDSSGVQPLPSEHGLHRAADAWRRRGTSLVARTWKISSASVLFFAIGAAFACYGVAVKSEEPLKASQDASTRKPAASDDRDGPRGRDDCGGLPGRDGRDGAPGRDGRDGAPGRDGRDGAPGRDGSDGRPGHDGLNGRPGRDCRATPGEVLPTRAPTTPCDCAPVKPTGAN